MTQGTLFFRTTVPNFSLRFGWPGTVVSSSGTPMPPTASVSQTGAVHFQTACVAAFSCCHDVRRAPQHGGVVIDDKNTVPIWQARAQQEGFLSGIHNSQLLQRCRSTRRHKTRPPGEEPQALGGRALVSHKHQGLGMPGPSKICARVRTAHP